MTEYKEHQIICIVQSDEANKAWVEFSQLVMDNPELQIKREAFDLVLNKILATRTFEVDAMDEAVSAIQKGAVKPMTEETVNWFVDLVDNIAAALKRAIPVLSSSRPGIVTKCELVDHNKRNFTLNVTILEPIVYKETLTVIHF